MFQSCKSEAEDREVFQDWTEGVTLACISKSEQVVLAKCRLCSIPSLLLSDHEESAPLEDAGGRQRGIAQSSQFLLRGADLTLSLLGDSVCYVTCSSLAQRVDCRTYCPLPSMVHQP